MPKEILHESSRLLMIEEDNWQYVHRKNTTGVVIMVAITPQRELVLVEQYRTPVHARVLELPAGVAGDIDASESMAVAANRELEEETGYRARSVTPLFESCVSPGLVSEVLSFFLMEDLEKVAAGGGIDDENITVHRVHIDKAEVFFEQFSAEGGMVDCKVYTGLYMAQKK